MKIERAKRILAAALGLVIVFSLTGYPAFAAEHTHDGACGYSAGSPCTHTEHDASCGYAEAVEGVPCNHEHNDDCYTEVTSCTHTHDVSCYPAVPLDATPSDGQEPTACTHTCTADSGCITIVLNCTHTHDDTCDYAEAVAGSPCKHEQGGHDDTCGYIAPSSCSYVQPNRPVLRATGWVEINGIWYFYNKDGSLASDEWKKSGDKWFYLDPEDGHRVVDELILYDGNYYYTDSTGARVHNTWVKVPNEGDIQMDNEATFFYFYMGSDGKAFRTKDGEAYHRYVIDGKSYFFDHIGRMLWGILPVDDDSGDFYYLGDFEDGVMVTGWQWLPADLFPAAPDGASKREDGWYYFKSNGKAQRGKENSVTIKRINGKDYGFGVDGRAYSGWVAEDGTQCLGDTAYQAGMYYFEPADAGKVSAGQLLKKCWLELNGNRFYFDDDGKKLHNVSREIGKTVWKFDPYGVAQTGDSYSIPVALRFYPSGLDGEGFLYEEDMQRTLAVGPTDLKVRASAYPAEITVAVQNADGGQSGSITYTRKGILAARNNTPKSSLTIPAYPGENGDGTEQWMADWSDGFTVAYVLDFAPSGGDEGDPPLSTDDDSGSEKDDTPPKTTNPIDTAWNGSGGFSVPLEFQPAQGLPVGTKLVVKPFTPAEENNTAVIDAIISEAVCADVESLSIAPDDIMCSDRVWDFFGQKYQVGDIIMFDGRFYSRFDSRFDSRLLEGSYIITEVQSEDRAVVTNVDTGMSLLSNTSYNPDNERSFLHLGAYPYVEQKNDCVWINGVNYFVRFTCGWDNEACFSFIYTMDGKPAGRYCVDGSGSVSAYFNQGCDPESLKEAQSFIDGSSYLTTIGTNDFAYSVYAPFAANISLSSGNSGGAMTFDISGLKAAFPEDTAFVAVHFGSDRIDYDESVIKWRNPNADSGMFLNDGSRWPLPIADEESKKTIKVNHLSPFAIYAFVPHEAEALGTDDSNTNADDKTDSTPQPAAPVEEKKFIVHKVVWGDTLWALSRKHGCTINEIVALNGELIKDPHWIYVGWELKIPQK